MNTKNRNYALLFSLLTLFFITISCDNEEGDTTKPSINLMAPEEGDILIIGDEEGIYFKAEFSDDVMLSSYAIDIHKHDGTHSHAKTRSEYEHNHDHGASNPFSITKSWNLPERQQATVEHREIVIPVGIDAGEYHLVVFCYDHAGNETYIAKNIILAE